MIEIPENPTMNAVMENVARISADYMGTLVDILSDRNTDSGTIIHNYVIPWAYEAEKAYRATAEEREAEGDYLDWLDEFVQNKINELRKESGKSGSFTLTFKGKKYPAVETRFGTVATKSLEKVLLDEHGSPIDQEAYDLDCRVFFYVPDEEILKGVGSVEKYVRDNIGRKE